MLLTLSAEQEFFRKTTVRFLEEAAPAGELRKRREDPNGFQSSYWRQGAELGWTSLLVSEENGGVSISGRGLVDLTVVAYEFGRHAAPGPLAHTNVVAGALSAGGADAELIGRVLEGSTIVAWCISEGVGAATNDGLPSLQLDIKLPGDELVLNGIKRSVESASQASHLLVTGRTGTGITQVLVPADAAGVRITPMQGIDLTRRFSLVRFEDVRVPLSAAVGEVGKAGAEVERQLQHALVLHSAEALGAMQAAFDLTVEWAFDRYSFGKPLAAYQALKHRFAHMATWLQASHAICDEAARAVNEGAPEAAELASAAKAYVGHYGSELLQDCVQLHGGIGVTYEHDLHLYLRRHTLIRTLLGTPDAHLRRLADLVAQKEAARG
jgi:alkylation response protein AidB-like acyl-CoA dehydrogenase